MCCVGLFYLLILLEGGPALMVSDLSPCEGVPLLYMSIYVMSSVSSVSRLLWFRFRFEVP